MTTEPASPPDGSSFTVRPGRVDDVEDLCRLVGLLAAHLGDQATFRSTPESFARYGFGTRPMFQTLLAIDDGADGSAAIGAVGACVYLADFSTWLGRPGVYILDLIVESTHRGRGIGSALLTEAARRGRARWDADYLILAVDRADHDALRFYRREGFEADDHRRVLIRRGLDDLVDQRRAHRPRAEGR